MSVLAPSTFRESGVRTATFGPMRAPLLAPDDGAPAAGAPAAAPAPAPAKAGPSTASKVADARASAKPVVVEGSATRAQSRATANAKVDKFAMQRALEASRAGRGNVDAKPEGAPAVPRAPDGRFAPRTQDPPETPDPANPLDADGTPAEGVEGQDEGEAPEVPAEVAAQIATLTTAKAEAETKLREGSALAGEKINELTIERDHARALFNNLIAGLKARGLEVDPLELKYAEDRLRLAKFEAGDKQRAALAQKAQIGQMATAIRAQIDNVISKHPELDPHGPNAELAKEAADFWRLRLHVAEGMPLPSLESLANDAAAMSQLLRARQSAKLQAARKAAAPPVPVARTRPSSMLPTGNGGSEGGAQPATGATRGSHVSNKSIVQHMDAYRNKRRG